MQFIDLKAQQHQQLADGRTLRQAIDQRIEAVLNHGQYILGPEVDELEQRLAAFVGVSHCVAVSSGTDALLIALMSCGVEPGDEVITSPFSFIATAETIALLGAIPVFVDIDPLTYNLDPNKLAHSITNKTKAIIPVSLYGQPADYSAINIIAAAHDLPVIEDAAQSFGSTHHGKLSCGLTTIGTTSFFPSKPLGCYGDGGACFTNDFQLAEKIRCISRHGQTRRYHHTLLGLNGRIDTLQAATLLAKLDLFATEVELRQRIASQLTNKLQAVGVNSTPHLLTSNTSVFAQYTIEVDSRSSVQSLLKAQGIPTAVHYPNLMCQQPALAHRAACSSTCHYSCNCPLAISASERVLSLPFHPYLSESDQDLIVSAVASSIQQIAGI